MIFVDYRKNFYKTKRTKFSNGQTTPVIQHSEGGTIYLWIDTEFESG